ncbi:MAG: hypothetical protein U1F57_12170 [bacterium]
MKPGQPEKKEKTEKVEKPVKAEKPVKTEKPVKVEKPAKEEAAVKPAKAERPKKAATAEPKAEVSKNLTVESKQFVHSKVNEVGSPVLFAVADGPARGTLILGKITEIQKMEKDQPGKLKINLESIALPGGGAAPFSGVVEVIREKGKDELGGKDVFMAAGYKQPVSISKKVTIKAAPAKKAKPAKGLLTSNAAIADGTVSVKVGVLKYPAKLDIYLEPPNGLKVADLNEESIRIVKVNDVVLPKPIAPTSDKIKVADHDKNNIQELDYKFDGWEVIQYLPEGNSTVTINAATKDGKPIEATAKVNSEFR